MERAHFDRLAALVLPAVAFLFLAAGCGDQGHRPDELSAAGPEALARLAVSVTPGDDRAVFMSDGRDAYYYDAIGGPQAEAAMGLTVGGFRLLDGWRWWFPVDSVGLGPMELSAARARPDFVVRSYQEVDTSAFFPRLIRRIRGPEFQHLTETITLLNGALIVTVPDSLGTIDLFPALSDRPSDGYTVVRQGDVLLIARSNYMEPRGDDPRPVWLAIAGADAQARTGSVNLANRFPRSHGDRERSTAPGRLRLQTPGSVAFAGGMTEEEAADAARTALAQQERGLQERQQWLLGALEGNSIQTEDRDFNRALAWSRITLEQLVREDEASADLRSGIPGIEGQRGWNTLQAMEGAFLTTGQWERAANMLRLYSRNQRFDRRIDIFGRAPSRFDQRGRPQYRTADAAAVLVGNLGAYLRTTGHEGLVLGERRLFWTNPVYVQRGYDDQQQLRSARGLIRNQDGQTWVQSAGGREAQTRGPESVEVQARYIENLRTMAELARIMGVSRQAQAYRDSIAAFQQRFERAFIENGHLADFRDGEGEREAVPRPSALFALKSFDLDPELERRILRNLSEQLVYEHGVSTRPQDDAQFYPFLSADQYEPAAARYEGTVWTALSGPLISLLTQHGAPERAHEQFRSLQRYALEYGVVGAIAENVDAHPRDRGGRTDVAVGGAPVQPWTLAEFIRVSFQDLAGVRHQGGNSVILEPNMPASWGTTTTVFRVGNGRVRATMSQNANRLEVALVPEGALPRDAHLRVRAFGQERRVALTRGVGEAGAIPADSTSLTITKDEIQQDGETISADARYDRPDPDFWEGFSWVQPDLREEYPVMERLEEERRLTADQVARDNPVATVILARTDPVGDDWGTTATFTYPTSYPPRIMDATYLEIAEDRDAFYFRIEMAALAGGAEFGHQPTFFALALNTGEGGQEQVGRNAQFRFPDGRGYNYIVFIGDGLRVEDDRGRVLGEFERLGEEVVDVDQARVLFSLPKFVVSALPRGTQVTLLVGANDGSRSPGRFRTVAPTATQQYGGGKVNPRDPNVYDVIVARVER